MNEDQIEELIADFVARRDAGEAVHPDDVIRAHPQWSIELRRAFDALDATETVLPDRGALPVRIGDWIITAELGRGGMGRVFDAHRDRVRAALKVLSAGAIAGPRALERIEREGAVLGRLGHPNVVRVLDVGVFEGAPFIAMERIDGPSLADVLAGAREQRHRSVPVELGLAGDGPPGERAARLIAQLARAVHAAHDTGLLHRDLKPGNVLLRGGTDPVLIDFGLAADDDAATLTRTGDLLGTPAYMAPEQARGDPADRRTDVRGLGALLHELLTLRTPFEAGEPLRVLQNARRTPMRIDARLRGPLRTIVARAVAFEPARRYPTAAELADDLERFVAGSSIEARPPSIAARATDLVRRHRRGAMLAPTAAALLALVAVVWLRDPDRQLRIDRALAEICDAWLAGDGARLEIGCAHLADEHPDHPVWIALRPSGPRQATDLLGIGLDRLERQGDASEAISLLEGAAAAMPGAVFPVVALGESALRAERYERAAEELVAAVRMLPSSARVRVRLAEALRGLDRLAEAESALAEATTLAPFDAVAWTELAGVRLERKDHAGALEASERAITLTDRPSRTLLRTHAAALDFNGRPDEAHAAFRAILARDPDDLGTKYSLAYSLDRAHRLREARDVYVELSRMRPRSPTLHATIAWLVSGSDRANCEECRAAFEADPDLLDEAAAERRLLEAMRRDRGRTGSLANTVVSVARRIQRTVALRALLTELLNDAHTDDDDTRILVVTKALRALDG